MVQALQACGRYLLSQITETARLAKEKRILTSILILGFLIGLQHALEADHVAAVASIASGEGSRRAIVTHGTAWGLGHTLSLFAFGGAIIVAGLAVPESFSGILEAAVGVVLIFLGITVIRRTLRDKITFSRHQHSDTGEHIHAHSMIGEAVQQKHDALLHRPENALTHRPENVLAHHRVNVLAHHHVNILAHHHPGGIPLRTFMVGILHGLAGTASLIVLTAASVYSPATGVLYILVFGAGSLIGMTVLSAVMSVPLYYTSSFFKKGSQALHTAIGFATFALGGYILFDALVNGVFVA